MIAQIAQSEEKIQGYQICVPNKQNPLVGDYLKIKTVGDYLQL